MAAIKGIARMRVLAGAAKPSPAIGQALGPLGVNMMEFCKSFNDRTGALVSETPMRVHLTAFQDRTFTFDVLSPDVSWFLKRAAGVDKGATSPGHDSPGKVGLRAVYEIAALKQRHDDHLSALPMPALVRNVCATAKSMGIKVVP
uniref:Large ribosomal subunit protein uL11m n=1 Tax=Bicosoecida sp. CB-2014 TaxID=1486930 RepID=A0A7S1C344_9STRA